MAADFCVLLGTALLGVGLWGLFTGGHDHKLLVFGVNAALNMVHLGAGALALLAALAGGRAVKLGCLALGVLFVTVAVAVFADVRPVVGALNLNRADGLLHAGLAAMCFWVGMASRAE